ncbi:hypothetical protein U1839_06035 [Sphingomonas sp. RT2P30]|uniref:hypothetical protein n=1 Tax=Parasphingomonas halimpatiens TaxID=3096162 RepID=UPI002FC5F72B
MQIAFFGADLTGVALSFAVKLARDVPSSALMTLTNGSGIAVIDVATDADGTPYSTLQLQMTKTAFMAAFAAYPAAVPGGAALFAYDLQWTPPTGLVAPATPLEETILTGNLFIQGSVNS